MPASSDRPERLHPARDQPTRDQPAQDGGARAILRVPEVLMEIAAARRGLSLAELDARLSIPKASLHRILRELERGDYLIHAAGGYRLGPNSFHLATLVAQAAPARPFPTCARPELERLAEATGETLMLGVLSETTAEVTYVDVIDSKAVVRFTIPIGDRRPLHSVASGKAVLAFLPDEALHAYLEQADFTPFTPQTTGKADLPGVLREIRATGVAFDCGGRAAGASALAGTPLVDNAVIMPFTLSAKYHFDLLGVKPYVGAGPALAVFAARRPSAEVQNLGLVSVSIPAKADVALQAGVDIPLDIKGFSLSLDVERYFVRPTASFKDASGAVQLQTTHKLDPLVLSAGVGYRF